MLIMPALLGLLTPPLSTADILARLGDSRCSHPERAGVRAAAVTGASEGGESALVQDVNAFATETGLRVSGVDGWSGSNEPYWHTNVLFLHSPRNTVVLEVAFDTRRRSVRLRVERNCFDDSPLEDWRPYWLGLVRHLRARNYVVRPINRARRR